MCNDMDPLETWFPYDSFRPGQRGMLDTCSKVAETGGIAMIDAPTGSGKSSVVAALLAARHHRKILVAVRTVSQLSTFARELSLIRKKQPMLKYAFLIGKGSVCPMASRGDVYRTCEGLKDLSTRLMRERADRGSMIPSRDAFIQHQLRKDNRDAPQFCRYFIESRVFVETETRTLRMIPSPAVRDRAERILAGEIDPAGISGGSCAICPYEAMTLAAQKADVIILNFTHLFVEAIREQLCDTLSLDPAGTLLLIDEAHNCGEAMQGAVSVEIHEELLEKAARELGGLPSRPGVVAAVQAFLPRMAGFLEGIRNLPDEEDWFDPTVFRTMVTRESLFKDIDEVVSDLMQLADAVREKNVKAGMYQKTAIEEVSEFMYRISLTAVDPSYLPIFRKDPEGLAISVRSIDPGKHLSDLAGQFFATILISGSLSPVESYKKLYFPNLPVTTLSLNNTFPIRNRMILCTKEITTSYSRRNDRKNRDLTDVYIRAFCRLKGNLAIYFPSYQMLESYAKRMDGHGLSKKVFIESRESADAGDALREFLSLPKKNQSGVLFAVCGGKWSEGLDYRGDLLTAAMVIGLPLAPYNRVRQMILAYFRMKYGDEGEFIAYTLPAVNKAQQALGRVLRTPDDRGVLVLADQRFLEPGVNRALPRWMQDELIPVFADEFEARISSWHR